MSTAYIQVDKSAGGEPYHIILSQHQALDLIQAIARKLQQRRRDGEGELIDWCVYLRLQLAPIPTTHSEATFD